MHEMGVARQMIDIALASIPEDIKDPRVEVIHLRIGKLAAVVEDSLKFCVEILSQGTALEGATLSIETVPVRAGCRGCGHEWTVEGPIFKCPECIEGAVDILAGRELEITSLEVAE